MNRLFTSTSLVGVALLAVVALASPLASRAQDATPVASGADRTITVNGRGTVTVAPDSASIVVGVDVTGDTLVETREESAQRMTAVLDTVEVAGIADDQVQTVNYSINVINEWDDQGRLQGVSGYQVSNQVQIVTQDLDGLGSLIDALVESGANTIYSINFFSSDATAALSQARVIAVADATTKATELAAAARRIPGAHVVQDVDGRLARGFGARTSGHVVAYDRGGALRLQGGLTISRGHAGDNRSTAHLRRMAEGAPVELLNAPVYGCDLLGETAP